MPLDKLLTPEGQAKVGNTTALLPVTDEVSKSEVRRWVLATLDDSPLWYDEAFAKKTRFGWGIAPAPFVRRTWGAVEQKPGYPDRMRMEGENGARRTGPLPGAQPEFDTSAVRIPLPQGVSAFHGDDETEYFRFPRVGEPVNVQLKLVKVEEKKGRSGLLCMIHTDYVYTNGKGELLSIVHFIQVAREVAKQRPQAPGT